jgi:PadR family transcriptional regulator, regulatory protein PadR
LSERAMSHNEGSAARPQDPAPQSAPSGCQPHLPLANLQEPSDIPVAVVLGEHRMSPAVEVLPGTLDLLILKTLALEPMHGWGIAQRIQQVSRDILQIQQGSLYPALYRLERKKWIRAEWGASENNRRAKFYALTKTGRQQLEKEMADWKQMSTAVALILQRV